MRKCDSFKVCFSILLIISITNLYSFCVSFHLIFFFAVYFDVSFSLCVFFFIIFLVVEMLFLLSHISLISSHFLSLFTFNSFLFWIVFCLFLNTVVPLFLILLLFLFFSSFHLSSLLPVLSKTMIYILLQCL